MKSNVCLLNKELNNYNEILNEVEKVTDYNMIKGKQALRLRLIAEELIGMVPTLVENFEGEFWVENKGLNYEFHVDIKVNDMNIDLRDELIAVSKSGKNAAAKGIMGKIRAVTETMMLAVTNPTPMFPINQYYDGNDVMIGFGYIDPKDACEIGYTYSWSLNNYKANVEENNRDAFEELEKSIVANLADDIIVGVKGKKVEIIIKKTVN